MHQYFNDRNQWKIDTFENLKRNLLSVKNNRFVQYGHTTTSQLVCVYGKSQVGKTTLILNMLGLKDESISTVAKVLRGGVTRGNSSTSTAIIYSQSDNEKYAVCIDTVDGKNISPNEYFSAEEMEKKLQSVREQVENDSFPIELILTISIPITYFAYSTSSKLLSIIDLPGVESRNARERPHVERLMKRYLPLASVCIITIPSNRIQELESLEVPQNWKLQPERYPVVITKSYSAGNIKSFFLDNPRPQRNCSFAEFIQLSYGEEITKILNEGYKTKVFLLDLGDSFDTLLDSIEEVEDKEELVKVRDKALSSLLCFISENNRQERLISTIKELRIIVEKEDQDKIDEHLEIINTKRKKQDDIEEGLKVLQTKQNKFEIDKEEVDADIKQVRNLLNKLSKEKDKIQSSFMPQFIRTVNKTINDKSLFHKKHGVLYFSDKNKEVRSAIYTFLYNDMEVKIKNSVISLAKEAGIEVEPQAFAQPVYNWFFNNYENMLYPRKFFAGIKDIPMDNANFYFKCMEYFSGPFISQYWDEARNKLNEKKDEYDKKLKDLNRRLNRIELSRNKSTSELDKIKKEISEKREEIEVLSIYKNDDINILNKYMYFANDAYKNQRNEIIRRINSNSSQSEKFMDLLLLGIIEKDYNSFIYASNGK